VLNKALGKALSVSLLNQVVTSGTNFAIVLYLVRVMKKAEFGIYSLGFAVMLLLAGLISSFIAVQYVVNLPDQHQSQRDDYAVHHANAVALLGVSLLLLAALLLLMPHDVMPGLSTIKPIVMSLSFASASYSLRDFLVRVAYSARRESYVLYSSVCMTVVVAAGYLILHQLGSGEVNAINALYVLAVSYLCGAITLAMMLRLQVTKSSLQGIRTAFVHSWHGGKWNVLAAALKRAQSQSYNIIVAPFLGLAAVADLNAARVLVTPAVMMVPPLTQIMLPRMAEDRKSSNSVSLGWTLILLPGLALAYSAFLLLLIPWLVPLTLGEAYSDVGLLVSFWCAFVVFFSLKSALVIALQAMRDFKALMWIGLGSFILTMVLCFFLAKLNGNPGVITAMAIAELLTAALIFFRIKSTTS